MSLPYLYPATIPYGSRVITDTTNSTTYIANNFRVTEPTRVLERDTELGAPYGVVAIQRARTGSAQLQLNTTTTLIPARGDEFTADTVTYFITEVGKPESADAIKVVDIQFREKI